MRIRVKDHVKLQADRMARIALATTERAQLDLYCVAPGQGQTCCGQPLFNSGYHGGASRVAARTVEVFRDAEHVVVPSGSCAYMVRHEYPALLRDTPARAEAERLAGRTYELSQFLVRVLGKTRFKASVSGRVTYHDSCHLLRGLHESEAPRILLKNLEGADLVELPGGDECC